MNLEANDYSISKSGDIMKFLLFHKDMDYMGCTKLNTLEGDLV